MNSSSVHPPPVPVRSNRRPDEPAARAALRFSTLSVPTWQSLRESVSYEVPAEHRAGFARAIAFGNWQRTAVLSAVVAITNVFFGIIPAATIFARTGGELRFVYAVLIGWHVFLVLFGLAVTVLARRDPPVNEAAAAPRHQRIALTFCAVMLTSMMFYSVLKHRVNGDIVLYLIGVAAVGSLFYLPGRFCAWLYVLTFSALVAGMILVHDAPLVTWIHTAQALVAISIFWVGSRLIYALKAMNHVQLVTIARQTEQLAAANHELARADQFKTELLAAAAHDLRDPLNTIALSAQLLREELPAGSEHRSLAGTIVDRACHMGEFINNLLTDAASTTHTITLDRTAIELPTFVASLVEHHRTLAAAKAIALHFTVDESARRAPPAQVDPVRFGQVVENLVTNAVKYSPAGKNVWITLTYDPAEGHRLAVRDEGPGLTAEDQQRLFAKYQRLSARPTGGEISTGLGLAIVKQLVELHGGRVWADSAGRGRGASFIVHVP